MQYRGNKCWEMDLQKTRNEYRTENKGGFPVFIKVGVCKGYFDREHSACAYEEIDNYIENHVIECDFETHESGPEVLVWMALGTAGITIAKSVIDLVTAIIKASAKGRRKGDRDDGNICLTIRDYDNIGTLKKETILEIKDCDAVTSEFIGKYINDVLNSK